MDGWSSVLRPRQHSIGYIGDGFFRSKDPTNSIKVLKGHIYTVSQKNAPTLKRYSSELYTVFRKKTPTHIFFHISMSDV